MKRPKILVRDPITNVKTIIRPVRFAVDQDGNTHEIENDSTSSEIGGRKLPDGWRWAEHHEVPDEWRSHIPPREPDTRGQAKPYRAPRAPGRRGVKW